MVSPGIDGVGADRSAGSQFIRKTRVILVGARRDARRLIRRLGGPWIGPPIVGFVDAGHSRSSSFAPRSRHLPLHSRTDPVPVLGSIDRLREHVDRARATHVVVAVSQKPTLHLRPHLTQVINSDVSVHWVLVDSSRLELESLAARCALVLPGIPGKKSQRRRSWLPFWADVNWARLAKRFLDVLVASSALLVLLPFFLAIALGILFTSGRPVFYTQERVGQGGRRFRMIKFRSMRCDAERETGPIWASNHDARCTPIGDWLRRTNIDELPQLVNVLRGEMSLVGPRPERPTFVEKFCQTIPDYDLRHAMAGGMTGWAQVHGWRGRTSLRKRIQYDLDYIQRWSFWLDLRILYMTIQHVLWGKTSW